MHYSPNYSSIKSTKVHNKSIKMIDRHARMCYNEVT